MKLLESEWRSFELELSGYMEKMNAWAARQAKRDKRASVAALEAMPEPTGELTDPNGFGSPPNRKDLLRARAYAARFGGSSA